MRKPRGESPTLFFERPLRSEDFGAGFGGQPRVTEIPGLGTPQPTEMILLPTHYRSQMTVVLESAALRLSLRYRVARARRVIAERIASWLADRKDSIDRALISAELAASRGAGTGADDVRVAPRTRLPPATEWIAVQTAEGAARELRGVWSRREPLGRRVSVRVSQCVGRAETAVLRGVAALVAPLRRRPRV